MKAVHAKSQLVLGALLALLGVAMLATTVAGGGGPLALGAIVGASFTALGAVRIWMAFQRPEGSRR